MNPVLRRRDRLALYLSAWLVAGGLLAMAVARPGGLSWDRSAIVLVPVLLVHGFVCLSSWYLCRATPLRTSGAATIVANLGGGSVAAGALFAALSNAWSRVLAWPAASSLAPLPPLVWDETPLLFAIGTLLYLLTTLANYVSISAAQSREAETRALGLQLLAREAELKTLRAQLDPHFLFNCLHSISALTGTDAGAARQMCLQLAEFLRSSVRLGAQDRIPFAEELALAERYLQIERVRFGPRLTVEREVADGVADCQVPALILQPLVENAVTHGVAHLLEGGSVRLEARQVDGGLRVVVENRCDPDRPRRPRTGVGLQNVRKRLAAQYGGGARVQVTEAADRFRVELTVPCAASLPAEKADV